MQDLKVTSVQANQVWEDKKANLEQFDKLLVPVSGVDLILLPEMFHTAFTMNGAELAEAMDDSMALIWLKKTAAEKQAAIYTSFIATENGRLYNRGVFVKPDGTVFIYDKRKTFALAGESDIYSSGTTQQIVSWKGWNINLQICYDLRFPEISRNGIAANGLPNYDLLLYIANWPERRITHWTALLQARAIENQCYVIGVNRVGTDNNSLTYSGNSAVFSAAGIAVHASGIHQESVDTILLSAAELIDLREKLPFLRDTITVQ